MYKYRRVYCSTAMNFITFAIENIRKHIHAASKCNLDDMVHRNHIRRRRVTLLANDGDRFVRQYILINVHQTIVNT